MLDGGAVPHDDSTTGIRVLTLPLGVDTGQVQRFPNLLQQVIHVEVELAAGKKQVASSNEDSIEKERAKN